MTRLVLAIVIVFPLLPAAAPARTISAIDITGLTRTRESAVRAACGYAPGDEWPVNGAQEIEANLWNLGIFKSVQVTAREDSSGGVVVLIRVQEMWTFYPYPVVRMAVNGDGLFAGFGFWDSNFLGLADLVNGRFEYSFQRKFFSDLRLTYRVRNPARTVSSIDLSIDYYHYLRDAASIERAGMSLGTTLEPIDHLYLAMTDVPLFTLSDPTSSGPQNYLSLEAGYSILRRRKYLEEGYRVSGTVYALPFYDGQLHSGVWGVMSGVYAAVLGTDNLLGRFRVEGTGSPFFAGKIDPAHYLRFVDDYSMDGDVGVQGNVEYRRLLFKTPWIGFLLTDLAVSATAFADGALYASGTPLVANGAVGAGIGARVVAYGLGTMVRFDFAINLSGLAASAIPWNRAWRFHVGLEDLF